MGIEHFKWLLEGMGVYMMFGDLCTLSREMYMRCRVWAKCGARFGSYEFML
jgi:hypothetical protein